jgi:hypothetical protein
MDLITAAQGTADSKVDSGVYASDKSNLQGDIAALESGKVNNSTHTAAIGGLETSISTINSTLSAHTTSIATAQQTADSKVDSGVYASDKSELQSDINRRVLQDSYDAHVNDITTAVNSKAAQDDFTLLLNNYNSTIVQKASDDEFQQHKEDTTYNLGLKADQSALSSYINNNDAAVATKVAQSDYDNRQNHLDYLDKSWENRFYALEEFVRAFLKTYNITKTDNTLYDYTGLSQNLDVPPPPFKLVGKKPLGTQSWTLCVQLTEYGYNTLMGDITFELPNGEILNNFEKSEVNGDSKYIEIPIGGARNPGTNTWNTSNCPLPLSIFQRNTKQESLCEVVITQAIIDALPLLSTFSPEKPTNLAYNAVTKILTFDVTNPNLIDFLDIEINGSVSYLVQDTSNLFKFENTHVTVNLNLVPVAPTTSIRVFTRYDKITGNANNETEIISLD